MIFNILLKYNLVSIVQNSFIISAVELLNFFIEKLPVLIKDIKQMTSYLFKLKI